MVAGFVEQQQIGLADQRARQQQAGVLAAAEGAGGQRPAHRFKPQLGKQRFTAPAFAEVLARGQLRQYRIQQGAGVQLRRQVLFDARHQTLV